MATGIWQTALALAGLAALAGCGTAAVERPTAWERPQALVAPSPFNGVHGLAIDAKGRLLAGSVVGNAIWEVDRATGAAKVFIAPPQGQADDIAVGPRGELAWTSFVQGIVHFRERDDAPIRALASGLPGINSIAFDMKSGRLYATQVFLGDALWEIALDGKPPRLIAKDLGGLNGFEVGPDGLIYGPLWFKHQVAKVDPSNGAVTPISDQFQIPAAANLDGKGNLWVVDARSGELSKVELATGRKTVAKQLSPALDNLAIAPEGTIYVSNMADNAVHVYDPASGSLRTLTSGKVSVPAGLKLDGDTLYVADVFAVRKVDVSSGAVTDVFRMQASDIEYPGGLGLSADRLLLSSGFFGSVQVVDRATLATRGFVRGLKWPSDALLLDDGSLIVVELGTGALTQASGPDFAQRRVIAQGLQGPVQMIRGRDGALVITELAGNLTRVELDGDKKVLASGLALPEGVAQTPWGSFVVAETAARRLTEIDPATGTKRTIADNLPIGLEPGPGLPPSYIPTGVAVGGDGTIYVSADRDNGIYRIRPAR